MAAESVHQQHQQHPQHQQHQAHPQPLQPAQHPAHPQHQAHPQPQQPLLQPHDPPIYRAMVTSWADRGKTLPGRHDPEWARLVAPTVRTGQFSASPDPRGDGR
ncbi:hypothetical protein [Streptomyces longispororuber]|uniref:hypothetical protein n=1 Tax=Streptomyces longispororuber TaxID=68230 RepID=UPI0021086B58|nr:hypothetical protein [Streptomyces longispororuber]MCQ4206497.1 hypothetical protein [Streptomyces longispororuber]